MFSSYPACLFKFCTWSLIIFFKILSENEGKSVRSRIIIAIGPNCKSFLKYIFISNQNNKPSVSLLCSVHNFLLNFLSLSITKCNFSIPRLLYNVLLLRNLSALVVRYRALSALEVKSKHHLFKYKIRVLQLVDVDTILLHLCCMCGVSKLHTRRGPQKLSSNYKTADQARKVGQRLI